MSTFRYYWSLIRFVLAFFVARPTFYDTSLQDRKKIIFFLAADYGNLGDIAITYSQRELLKKNFPDHVYIEIPKQNTLSAIKGLRRVMNKDDVITLVGGGNMGDIYIGFERFRRLIVRQFRNNRIVSFPQTIDFSDTPRGRKEFRISQKVYSRHPRITLIAREQATYDIMKRAYSANILLTPDIVMALGESQTGIKRDLSTAILCIRDDKETILDKKDSERINKVIGKLFNRVEIYDTHIGTVTLDTEEGERELRKIWNAFSRAGIVVTDRLHGMIFCVITGTPCIAMNNTNGKVAGVYNLWLKDLPYIYLCGSVAEIENIDLKKIQQSSRTYNPQRFNKYWNSIVDAIRA